MQRLPGWFRALFVVVMLFTCAVVAWFAFEQSDLLFRLDDVSRSLDTSRQRMQKQQYEHDQFVAALPEVEAELARVQPLADAAMAQDKALRDQRKALRAEVKELQQQLADAEAARTAAQEQLAELEATIAELERLIARRDALISEGNALLAPYSPIP